MTRHKDLVSTDAHVIHGFTYASTVARTGATGLVTADKGKVARQSDDESYWILTSTGPVWRNIGDGGLDDIASLAPSNNNFIVGDGTNWKKEAPSSSRVSLGLVIGTDVQAYDTDLSVIANIIASDSNFLVGDGTSWAKETGSTARTSIGFTAPILDRAAPGGIGGTTPGAGAFTTLSATGDMAVDTDTLFVNTTTKRIGAGTASPDEHVHLSKDVDGAFIGLLIENSRPADAGTNETVEVRFGFGGNNDVARIQVTKEGDYQTGANEDSAYGFWIDLNGVITKVMSVVNSGLLLGVPASKVDFNGTAGGGGQGLRYKDAGGSLRSAVQFPGSDLVVISNQASDGAVEIRANTSTAGSGGEVTVARFEDDKIGVFTVTPAARAAAYTRNATIVEDRTLLASASATATNNNNVLAAMIADLQAYGWLG